MGDTSYSHMIKPEDIQTRSKLDNYNETLLEVLTWMTVNTPAGEANQLAAEMKAAVIYASMTPHDKEVADLNRARIFRGEHQDNGQSTTN